MPEIKTVAERILELVKLLGNEVDGLSKKVGEIGMEPIDRRLRRMEAKIHAIGNGTFGQQDDGMDQPFEDRR